MGSNKDAITLKITAAESVLGQDVANALMLRINGVAETSDGLLLLPKDGLTVYRYPLIDASGGIPNVEPPCCKAAVPALYWTSVGRTAETIADDILFETFNAGLHKRYIASTRMSSRVADALTVYGKVMGGIEGSATFHYAKLVQYLENNASIALTADGTKSVNALASRNHKQYQEYTCDTAHKTGATGTLGWKTYIKYAYERLKDCKPTFIGSLVATGVESTMNVSRADKWKSGMHGPTQKSVYTKGVRKAMESLLTESKPSGFVIVVGLLAARTIQGKLASDLNLGTFGFPSDYHKKIKDWVKVDPDKADKQSLKTILDREIPVN